MAKLYYSTNVSHTPFDFNIPVGGISAVEVIVKSRWSFKPLPKIKGVKSQLQVKK